LEKPVKIPAALLLQILYKGAVHKYAQERRTHAQNREKFYFRKIPLHQQKFLMVSVLSNSLWLPRILKNV